MSGLLDHMNGRVVKVLVSNSQCRLLETDSHCPANTQNTDDIRKNQLQICNWRQNQKEISKRGHTKNKRDAGQKG